MLNNLKFHETENPAPGPRGASESDLLASPVNSENTNTRDLTQDDISYLLAECHGTVLRLKIQTNEVVTIGLAFKLGFISPEAMVNAIRDLGVPFFFCGQPSDEGAV